MPRRVNDGIAALHARAAEQLEKDPQTPVTAAQTASDLRSEPFDFERYCLESYASKVAIGMKGQRYASTPRGKALAEKIVHHLEAGEMLKISKLRSSSTYNRPPNLKESMVKLQRKQDRSMFPGSGLF
tara:strand:+ start:1227 stop:1610 length:384 start_codon:yes stop_codon:yes gene_type:complete